MQYAMGAQRNSAQGVGSLRERRAMVMSTLAPSALMTTPLVRNPGMPLDLGLVQAARVNRSAVERRAATLPARRTVKREWQAAWLLRAITTIDLTTLAGDDTPGNVRRLCAKARHPLQEDLARALGAEDLPITVGA